MKCPHTLVIIYPILTQRCTYSLQRIRIITPLSPGENCYISVSTQRDTYPLKYSYFCFRIITFMFVL